MLHTSRGRRYEGHFFKFHWPGSYFGVNVHLNMDQKIFLGYMHFSRFAGQKTKKTHFSIFEKKYLSYDHNFAAQMSPIPYFLLTEKIPNLQSLFLAVLPKRLK